MGLPNKTVNRCFFILTKSTKNYPTMGAGYEPDLYPQTKNPTSVDRLNSWCTFSHN